MEENLNTPAKRNRRPLTVRIPSDLMKALRDLSAATGINQAALVSNAIKLLIAKKEIQNLAKCVTDAELEFERSAAQKGEP